MMDVPPTAHSDRDLTTDAPGRVWSVDVWVWVCTSASLLLMYLYPGFAPGVGPDSYQYLSVAQNALDGRFAYTSLVHFDAERSFGVIPAPMVTFPPGYPLALALVSLGGASLSTAGLLMSFVSTVACVPLLAWLCAELSISRPLRNIAIAGFVFNATVIKLGTNVASDAFFTFLALLGVALLVSARRQTVQRSAWRWVAAGVAFGMAYVVRYAGMFFVIGLALLVLLHWYLSERGLAKRFALAFAVAGAATLMGIARNITLVGNWRGGNEKLVNNPLSSVLVETARGANRLILGPGAGIAGATFIPRAALVLLFIVGISWVVRNQLRRRVVANDACARVGARGLWMDLLLLAVAYASCLFYAGLKSVIDYGDARYFAPLLPLLMVLLGVALQPALKASPPGSAARKVSLTALTAGLCLYAFLNLLVVTGKPRADWLSTAKVLDSISGNGKSARTVIQELVGANGVVVANNGQTIGYLLARPTVSLVGPFFSSVEWNEKAILLAARQFRAKAIVISVPDSDQWGNDDIVPSRFVKGLAQGEGPSWMRLVYRGENMMIYAPFPEDGTLTQ